MLIQSTASSLSASASSKVSISCAANNVNPRTRANATMWNFRFKIIPSQAERIVPHSTSTLIRSGRRKGCDVALGLFRAGLDVSRQTSHSLAK
jgi:hypothetical protein